MRVGHKCRALWVGAALAAVTFAFCHSSVTRAAGHVDTGRLNSLASNTASKAYCDPHLPSQHSVKLLLGQSADGNSSLGFFSPSWKLIHGTVTPIDLTFDGKFEFHLLGAVVNSSFISVPLPAAALERLRQSFVVGSARSHGFYFVLAPAQKIIQSITRCLGDFEARRSIRDRMGSIPTHTLFMSTVSAKTASSQEVISNEPAVEKLNGTGFAISTSGFVVTNNHVVGGCVGDIYGNLPGRTAMTLSIVSQDARNDLALLQAAQGFEQTAILSDTPVRQTETILAVGYPFHGVTSFNFTIAKGVISSLSGPLNDDRYLQITAPIHPGDSGSPLLDTSGHLVGLILGTSSKRRIDTSTNATSETVGFAIKVSGLKDFLKRSNVAYHTSDSGAQQTTAEITAAARSYTVLISCKGIDDAISKN